MQIVRTILWVLLFAALLVFSIANWEPTVTVRIWEGLVVDTKIPAIVITSFLIGIIPMWLVLRGTRWHFSRRIRSLESAARTVAMTPIAPETVDEPASDEAPEGVGEETGEQATTQDAGVSEDADAAPVLDNQNKSEAS